MTWAGRGGALGAHPPSQVLVRTLSPYSPLFPRRQGSTCYLHLRCWAPCSSSTHPATPHLCTCCKGHCGPSTLRSAGPQAAYALTASDTPSCSACGLWVDERAPRLPALLTPLPGSLPWSLKTGLGVPSPVHSLPQPRPVTTGHQVCFPNYSDPEGIGGTGGAVLSTAGTDG